MVADFSKILSHPDKDEIISKLVTGIKPRDVSDWLKLKYSDKEQGHLRVSSKILQDFVENNLDLYNVLQNDISGVKQNKKEISDSLKNNKTYQERIVEIADKELDIKRLLIETGHIIRQRVEQVFDKIQENPQNFKPDYTLIKWLETLLNFTDRYQKIVNEAPDTVVQHNINIQLVEQHTIMLQDAIRETMAEIDSDMSFRFLEKLNSKMATLKSPEAQILSQDKKLLEAQIISSKINDEEPP
jgi:cobalamin biosynthesis Co2+ chelatase CbiK